MGNRWNKSKTAVYNVNYHIIWCPKYRRKVLVDGVDERLKELILEKANEHGWEIKSMEVMPDHVHIFISANPVDGIHYIVQQIKGYSSRVLRQEFTWLNKRLPSLWTRSYYAETVGHISERTVKRYIENQKSV